MIHDGSDTKDGCKISASSAAMKTAAMIASNVSMFLPCRRTESATAPSSNAPMLRATAMTSNCVTRLVRSNFSTSLSQDAAHKDCRAHADPMHVEEIGVILQNPIRSDGLQADYLSRALRSCVLLSKNRSQRLWWHWMRQAPQIDRASLPVTNAAAGAVAVTAPCAPRNSDRCVWRTSTTCAHEPYIQWSARFHFVSPRHELSSTGRSPWHRFSAGRDARD
ncbi:hypothetical protein ABIB80_004440 [Bradyrhizobium sp. i1.15.2]